MATTRITSREILRDENFTIAISLAETRENYPAQGLILAIARGFDEFGFVDYLTDIARLYLKLVTA